MNIDLLINKTHDVGLVTTGKFESTITAVMLDHETLELSLEFGETMDSMAMNIPVGYDLIPFMRNRTKIFVIGTDKVHIHEAYDVPLVHINDAKSNDVGEWK